MATLPDSAMPDCTNPQHPAGLPRKMRFLQYRDSAYVFGCQACRDVNRKLSIRVLTDQYLRRKTRQSLVSAGRVLTAPLRRRPVSPYELDRRRELSEQARRDRAPATIDWDPGARRSRDGKYELVEYRELGGGALQIQMAINGKLAPQMDDHVASREEFRSEEAYWTRVARGSELMLHLYGDPRYPLTPEESAQREQEMY
jgi:hypothetical protein